MGYILAVEMYPTQAKKRLEWATLPLKARRVDPFLVTRVGASGSAHQMVEMVSLKRPEAVGRGIFNWMR